MGYYDKVTPWELTLDASRTSLAVLSADTDVCAVRRHAVLCH